MRHHVNITVWSEEDDDDSQSEVEEEEEVRSFDNYEEARAFFDAICLITILSPEQQKEPST